MTDTISTPLNKLLAWEGNVRKTDADKGIHELAASIYPMAFCSRSCSSPFMPARRRGRISSRLYWLLMSFFSACAEVGAYPYVVCQE